MKSLVFFTHGDGVYHAKICTSIEGLSSSEAANSSASHVWGLEPHDEIIAVVHQRLSTTGELANFNPMIHEVYIDEEQVDLESPASAT